MQRKRPAQRQNNSRSVIKSKTRSFNLTRSTRSSRPVSKSPQRSWFSKRKKPTSIPKKSNKSLSFTSWLQTALLWIVLLIAGGWLVWYILVWGVGAKLLSQQNSSTIAILPTIAGGEVLLVQLEPELKDSTVFILDGEEVVTLPGLYGEYRLSAIYPLLLIDAKDDRYFRGTLNRVFGVFLDSEVLVDQTLVSDPKELSKQLKATFWKQVFAGEEISLDLIKTWYVLQYNNTVRNPESVKTVVDEIRAQTGGTFATRDECRVAILNSTTTSGLAGGLADIVEKNGGLVIRLGQYSDVLETSKLLYDPAVEECQEAIEQIKTLSPVSFEVEASVNVQGEFRAPLVAIIGKNFE
jgi:hypothetical protein